MTTDHYDYIRELTAIAEERGWYIQELTAGSVTLARGRDEVQITSRDPLRLVREMPVQHPTKAEDGRAR